MQYKRYNWQLSRENPFHFSRQNFICKEENKILDVHQALHLTCILSGAAVTRHGNETFSMQTGDLFLTPPWEIHGITHISAGLKLYNLTIDTESLLKALQFCFGRLQNLFLIPAAERWKLLQNQELKDRLKPLLAVLSTWEHPAENLQRMKQWLLIQQLFLVLLESIPLKDDLTCEALRLAPALELLTSGKNLRISEAAEACHLSVSRFSHLFRKIYHISFKAYQMEQRLNRAAVHLKAGMSVKETAARENFFDTSYFVKCFIRRFGTTPGRFR